MADLLPPHLLQRLHLLQRANDRSTLPWWILYVYQVLPSSLSYLPPLCCCYRCLWVVLVVAVAVGVGVLVMVVDAAVGSAAGGGGCGGQW